MPHIKCTNCENIHNYESTQNWMCNFCSNKVLPLFNQEPTLSAPTSVFLAVPSTSVPAINHTAKQLHAQFINKRLEFRYIINQARHIAESYNTYLNNLFRFPRPNITVSIGYQGYLQIDGLGTHADVLKRLTPIELFYVLDPGPPYLLTGDFADVFERAKEEFGNELTNELIIWLFLMCEIESSKMSRAYVSRVFEHAKYLHPQAYNEVCNYLNNKHTYWTEQIIGNGLEILGQFLSKNLTRKINRRLTGLNQTIGNELVEDSDHDEQAMAAEILKRIKSEGKNMSGFVRSKNI